MFVVAAVLGSATAEARYAPDTTVAPGGAFDVGIRGNAAISPGALYRNIAGDGFVTIARRDTVVAVCAYTSGGALQNIFGNGGCYQETFPATAVPYQLLVGRSVYWVLISDTSNARRFTLLRLTITGQPDTAYGPAGRRTFELACDATDTAPRCPEVGGQGAQQPLGSRAFIAETTDSNLWLMGTRKTANGADEGVLFRLDQARNITARANLWDALPPNWLPSMQASVSLAYGVVAHGDGVLVEHRTNFGYVLIRVDGSGAIDRTFGAQGIATTGGDAALPSGYYQLPLVAADNSFLWGIPGNDAKSRSRYDARGAVLGAYAMPANAAGTMIATASPASIAGANVPLWIWDGTRVGRWLSGEPGGQWDPTAFGGQGTFVPSTAQTSFTMTRDDSTLAMITQGSFAGIAAADARLTLVDTRSSPQPVVAAPIIQPNALLAATAFRTTADSLVRIRWATQADGSVVWQRLVIDPFASMPTVTTGTLATMPAGTMSYLLVSNASATGERWVLRTQTSDFTKPVEFYADLVSGSTGSTPHRINVDAIRAEMPAFIPVTPFSNPAFINVDIAADGSAAALVLYARGTVGALQYRVAMVRWGPNLSAAGEYVAQFVWSADDGSQTLVPIQRDAQGRVLVINTSDRSVIRLDLQGARDVTFGQAGRLDLLSLGFVAADLGGGTFPAVRTLPDGSAWIATANRLVRVDRNAQPLAQTTLPRPAPQVSGSPDYWTIDDVLADSDGGALVVYANATQFRLLRYTAAVDLDQQFGLRGAEALLPDSVTFTSAAGSGGSPANSRSAVVVSGALLPTSNRGIAIVLNDTVGVFRYDPAQPGPSGATMPAVEFYNTTLDHYFMTADVAEIAGIETGAAGPGWQRTGQAFPVYSSLADAPGDALDVCRFYGSAVPRSSSPNGRTGPNSHFYTVSGTECDSVNAKDKAWQYEGPRLALMPLPASNTCAAGQQPVFRAYNNGYQITGGVWTKNDSNHRYSTSRAIIGEMAGKGWADEGAVFCVPN